MKKLLAFLILLGGSYYLISSYKEDIINYTTYLFNAQRKIIVPPANEYKREYNYQYVNNTDLFIPQSKKDLINIYYTIINSGWLEFSFYCPKDYIGCLTDVTNIANDQVLLSHLNNFVHPFNSYKEIKTSYDGFGNITIYVTKTYTEETISLITAKVNTIIEEIITEEMIIKEKIRVVHDYIINHTKYDSERLNNKIIKYDSETSYGVLFEGYGFCSGYADTMAIFLHEFNLNNYKIASERHIWNFLYVDDGWYHIDVAWDDPVNETRDILDHTYFLIDTKTLVNLKIEDHDFDETIYLEAIENTL